MQDLKTYLSTAPVLAILCVSFLAALLIEINRFFPDGLFFFSFLFLIFLLKPREKRLC